MDNLKQKIEEVCGILKGKHFFILREGLVTTKYVDIDPILTRPAFVEVISQKLIQPFANECTAVVAPAVGAIPFIYGCARALRIGNMSTAFRTAFPEKESNGTFEFKRLGFSDAVKGRDVVVIEDVLSTGSSAKYTIDCVREAGGAVIGVSAIWNRGGITPKKLNIPRLNSLITQPIKSWEAGRHPRWGKWPIVSDIGHPELVPRYPGGYIELLGT